MANELKLSAGTGLTAVVQLYSGTTPVGSPISTIEIGTTGEYVGSMPAGIPFGIYLGVFSAGGVKIASAEIFWDGQYELPISMARINGLDPSNPTINKSTQRKSGDIVLNVDGYGSPTTTVTRQ